MCNSAATAAAAVCAAAAAAAGHTTLLARAAPQCACVGWHLVNRCEMHVSASDSYALMFL